MDLNNCVEITRLESKLKHSNGIIKKLSETIEDKDRQIEALKAINEVYKESIYNEYR